jgi:hypothetical protein
VHRNGRAFIARASERSLGAAAFARSRLVPKTQDLQATPRTPQDLRGLDRLEWKTTPRLRVAHSLQFAANRAESSMRQHRKELNERVVARRKQLQEAFTLAELEGPSERRNALEVALRVVDNAAQGGWDKVSEVGAAELSQWLEETQFLVASPVSDEAGPEAKEPALRKESDPRKLPTDGVGMVWEEGTTTQSIGPHGESARWRSGR